MVNRAYGMWLLRRRRALPLLTAAVFCCGMLLVWMQHPQLQHQLQRQLQPQQLQLQELPTGWSSSRVLMMNGGQAALETPLTLAVLNGRVEKAAGSLGAASTGKQRAHDPSSSAAVATDERDSSELHTTTEPIDWSSRPPQPHHPTTTASTEAPPEATTERKFLCLPAPVVSAAPGGRLGNNLAEYATVFSLGLRYNLTTVTTPDLLRLMKDPFPHLSLPVVDDSCTAEDQGILVEAFQALDDEAKHVHSWKITYYTHRVSLFWWYREQLMKEFTFKPEYAAIAQWKLTQVADGRTNLTFVGVHVRRTDYAHHLDVVFNGTLVNESFYLGAMELCRERYHQPVFIVTSDDMEWCRKHLAGPDVHVVGAPPTEHSPAADLALMAACNHTVFDYGTFGFFGAFLAGGDMILAEGYSQKEHEIVSELRIGGINATYLDPAGRQLPSCLLCE